MEQSSCTEDRIQHVLERCLCDLRLDTPDKQLWNAGLCINRWCLEELVRRDPNNFLILLQKILRKTRMVLEQCCYELVVPLSLLFSSTLLQTPYLPPDNGVLQEAYLLFQGFLSWPHPCSSASKHLLHIIHHELRAPGISFQRLVRTEQGISHEIHSSKTITVLLVSPDQDVPPEVRSVSKQLSLTQQSDRDIIITLILHSFQAVLGPKHDLQPLYGALRTKQPEELQQLLEAVTGCMETSAATADLSTARQGLLDRMEGLRKNLVGPVSADGCSDSGAIETFMLPFPKCHTCSWENDNFDILDDILGRESDMDLLPDCFVKIEVDHDNNNSVDEEDEVEGNKGDKDIQNHRSSKDSGFSLSSSWSAVSSLSGSSGVESDFSEDMGHEDAEEGQESALRPRKKPKKKSRSLLGIERFSSLFKTPRSPSSSHHDQSTDGDFTKDSQKTRSQLKHTKSQSSHVPTAPSPSAALDRFSPRKHTCVRRRPILSCSDADAADVVTQVRVVVFGGDKEAGRLARAYSDLQRKESKCRRLTKLCRLQFYFVPTKRISSGCSAEGQMGGPTKAGASAESNGVLQVDSTNHIAQMMGMMDPWYERNILSLLSLSSDVLCQTACKDNSVSESGGGSGSGGGGGGGGGGGVERLPLLADMVLYYCRHAEQPVLVQLYQAELTLAGGERRSEVFIHSLELGHTAATRAVRAMGAASKRFGIDEEREAVPLTLKVAYNKVAVSGRSQWTQTEMACTSINLYKACRKPEQLDSRTECLQLTMTEALKRQCNKSKKSYNQNFSVSEAKVDKVQVNSGEEGATFAVCLDQDKRKFIQGVIRVEVCLCCKPGSTSDWRTYRPSPGQVQPLHPSYCSLLCLPITSFSAAYQ